MSSSLVRMRIVRGGAPSLARKGEQLPVARFSLFFTGTPDRRGLAPPAPSPPLILLDETNPFIADAGRQMYCSNHAMCRCFKSPQQKPFQGTTSGCHFRGGYKNQRAYVSGCIPQQENSLLPLLRTRPAPSPSPPAKQKHMTRSTSRWVSLP